MAPQSTGTAPPTLGATQRRIDGWIRGSSAPDEAAVAEVLRHDRDPSPIARLGVYANAWFVRIRDVLRDDFGALAALLGEEAWSALARGYLGAHPTASPSLRDAGAQLPGFLRSHADAAEVRARVPFAADLARLEWALTEAFDAPDAPLLERAALAALAPDAWSTLRLETTPSLTLLALDWPVQRVKRAFDADDEAGARTAGAALSRETTHLRVWRRDERVFHRPMDATEATTLAAAQAGEPFGALCERVAEEVGPDEAVLRTARQLETWLADGVFSRIKR